MVSHRQKGDSTVTFSEKIPEFSAHTILLGRVGGHLFFFLELSRVSEHIILLHFILNSFE